MSDELKSSLAAPRLRNASPDPLRSRFVHTLATLIVLFEDAEEAQRQRIRELERENRALKSEVLSLKHELEAVERVGGLHE